MNNQNQNTILLIVVILSGLLGYYVYNNNVSFKGLLKNIQTQNQTDNYTSPFGPKPSNVWERSWEAERAK